MSVVVVVVVVIYRACTRPEGIQDHPDGYSGVVRDRLKHHLSSAVSIKKIFKYELAYRLALDGLTESQVYSQVHANC